METGHFVLLCFSFFAISLRSVDAYDPIDPNGNVTINWDFQSIDSVYTVMVSIHNNQLYRHFEQPGWRLSWEWAGEEVIWDMKGAEATEQGNCTAFGGPAVPHCCERRPVVVDLPPGAPYNAQVANCCRGGVLSSLAQRQEASRAAFQMVVGGGGGADAKPTGFSIGVPGYTCSNATDVPPTKFRFDRQRHTQVLKTWQITCSYSQFRASAAPSCCVSLSAFYNSNIVSCPACSCGCQSTPSATPCTSDGDQRDALQLVDGNGGTAAPAIVCTEHMCPVRVHWHVKMNYREYWRVKVTITSYNLLQNYSDWNLVVQHPSLRSLMQLFSFNYEPLVQYGTINDTGLLWGLPYYNEMLLQGGNVQTEMILKKDSSDFTFKGGWAFPRRVYFDGHQCVMPPPDEYPLLPNGIPGAPRRSTSSLSCLLLLAVLLFL